MNNSEDLVRQHQKFSKEILLHQKACMKKDDDDDILSEDEDDEEYDIFGNNDDEEEDDNNYNDFELSELKSYSDIQKEMNKNKYEKEENEDNLDIYSLPSSVNEIFDSDNEEENIDKMMNYDFRTDYYTPYRKDIITDKGMDSNSNTKTSNLKVNTNNSNYDSNQQRYPESNFVSYRDKNIKWDYFEDLKPTIQKDEFDINEFISLFDDLPFTIVGLKKPINYLSRCGSDSDNHLIVSTFMSFIVEQEKYHSFVQIVLREAFPKVYNPHIKKMNSDIYYMYMDRMINLE